jgi:hypothetical protein
MHEGAEANMSARRRLSDMQALRAARDLLAEPARWCRSAPARTLRTASRGHKPAWVRCGALDGHAMRWCAAGALVKATGIDSGPPGLRALDRAAVDRFGVGIGRANDDPRIAHAAILACFDAAIAATGTGRDENA